MHAAWRVMYCVAGEAVVRTAVHLCAYTSLWRAPRTISLHLASGLQDACAADGQMAHAAQVQKWRGWRGPPAKKWIWRLFVAGGMLWCCQSVPSYMRRKQLHCQCDQGITTSMSRGHHHGEYISQVLEATRAANVRVSRPST